MIDINDLRAIAKDESKVEFTAHTHMRMREREITVDEIYAGIDTGEIIEQYPDDKYYPSCLVLCFRVNGKPLHFVCGLGDNKIYIITLYDPDLERWENDFKTRRRRISQ